MASPHSTRTASRPGTPLMWPQFHIGDSPPVTAHRETHISEPHSSQRQSWLRTQIEELKTVGRRKDESLAILLHELRSPLSSIQNAIAVLRMGSKDESFQQHMHELIDRQVRQIALLTSSLCQMSGPRLQNLPMQRERMELCTVLSRAAETVTPEIAKHQQQLLLSLPEKSLWIVGDASRLEQVFVNLLSNASKYSNAGDTIVMSAHVCDGQAEIQVRDSGIGIAAGSMPHIFDLFERAGTTAVQTQGGLGIGLALVRSIVDSHCGSVSATSGGIGQGSKFTVRLKLEN